MLRFNSTFLTMIDAVVAFIIQTVAASKIGFLLVPAYFLKKFWIVWVLSIAWAAFLRTLDFKVGFWWSLACSSILVVASWGWSLLTFFYWDDGPVLSQWMPAVASVVWVFLLFQIKQALVVRLPVAQWVKKTIEVIMVLFWIDLAFATIVDYDFSSITLIGAALIGYYYFRLTATVYIRGGKRLQQFFGVDGKI